MEEEEERSNSPVLPPLSQLIANEKFLKGAAGVGNQEGLSPPPPARRRYIHTTYILDSSRLIMTNARSH